MTKVEKLDFVVGAICYLLTKSDRSTGNLTIVGRTENDVLGRIQQPEAQLVSHTIDGKHPNSMKQTIDMTVM